MYGRKVKLRFFFILLIIITISLSGFLVLKSLEENVVYFQSPSEIKLLAEIKQKSFNDMDKITSENFNKLFSLK